MTHRIRIIVADFTPNRRAHLMLGLREQFGDVEVHELPTEPYDSDSTKDTDFSKLAPLRTNRYDLLIAHTGGNPSGFLCLKHFKTHNPKGKAILYTKAESIPLKEFEAFRLANAIFRRADDDTKVFPNDAQMLELVNRVLKEPGIVEWASPFKDRKVLGALLGLGTAIAGLAAKAFG